MKPEIQGWALATTVAKTFQCCVWPNKLLLAALSRNTLWPLRFDTENLAFLFFALLRCRCREK